MAEDSISWCLMRLSPLFSDITIVHLSFVSCLEGLTHWSLTGSAATDEDTLMGFSDGLSQSGIYYL